MTDQIHQRGVVGTVDVVFAVDTRVAAGAVVVDQQSLQAQGLVDDGVQLQQIVTLQCLVKTLHQQLRAVTVDGQAASAFLAAMEQAIAIGALAVQYREQVLTLIEGGAQRLIQGRHAGALLERIGAREFNSY